MHMYPAHERLEHKFFKQQKLFKKKSQHKTIKLMFFFLLLFISTLYMNLKNFESSNNLIKVSKIFFD